MLITATDLTLHLLLGKIQSETSATSNRGCTDFAFGKNNIPLLVLVKNFVGIFLNFSTFFFTRKARGIFADQQLTLSRNVF